MVLQNNVDGLDTRFATMVGPLVNNPLGKCLGVIRIGTYQAESEDRRWVYEKVSYLSPYIELVSDYSDDGSSDEVIKYQ